MVDDTPVGAVGSREDIDGNNLDSDGLYPPDQAQRQAAIDPQDSLVVQAPAGSGKTRLLVERYLKLLNVVQKPEEILAITFTRKAAKEMRTRVLNQLRDRSALALPVLERDDNLGWHITENPQRLRIQTIDSFCAYIVRSLPVASQLGLDFDHVENIASLYEEAADDLLGEIAGDSPFADEIAQFIAFNDNDYGTAQSQIVQMLGRRDRWYKLIRATTADDARQAATMLKDDLIAARRRLVDREIHEFRSGLGKDETSAMDHLLRLIATHVRRSEPSDIDLERDATPQYREFGRLFVTQKQTIKKRTNRKIVAKRNKRSEDADSLLRPFFEIHGFESRLHRLSILPNIEINEEESHAVSNYALVLSLALIYLKRVFERHQSVDFTEVAAGADRALGSLSSPSDLLLSLDHRISHILVDEYQDTSIMQHSLLTQLTAGWTPDDGNSFFAVGDPMQSIYGFRNADLRVFQKTIHEGISDVGLDKITLTSNFRSSPAVVQFTNDLFSGLFSAHDDADSGMVSFAPAEPARVELQGDVSGFIAVGEDETLQAQEVSRRVARLRKKFPEDSIAILVRQRTSLPSLLQEFQKENLTWKGTEIVGLTRVPVVRDLHAIAQVVADSRDRLACLALLRSPLCGLKRVDLEVVAEYETAEEMFAVAAHCDVAKRVAVLGQLYREMREDKHRTLRSRIERIWYQLGGADAYADPDTIENADRYLDILEDHCDSGRDIATLMSRLEKEYATETAPDADVEVMTIHKSKGLEFDHVILYDLQRATMSDATPLLAWEHDLGDRTDPGHLLIASNQETGLGEKQNDGRLFDWLHERSHDRTKNEKIRLLYVAVTRAVKTLTLAGSLVSLDKNPRSNTLLGLIYEAVGSFSKWKIVDGSAVDEDTNDEERHEIRRLVPDYSWSAPSRRVVHKDLLSPFRPEPTKERDPLGLQNEILLGTLVHDEMRRLTLMDDGEEVALDNYQYLKSEFMGQGLDSDDIDYILETAKSQLERVLLDRTGRWLISNSHEDSSCERAFVGMTHEGMKEVRIDRTFVDRNVRWIVEYKTGQQDVETGELERRAIGAYEDQLKEYARILGAHDTDHPIRTAIYLTDIPSFIPLDVP